MKVGDTIHLNGIKAEYRLHGKSSCYGCILPDGDYVVLKFEHGQTDLAWREAGGHPSKKHRYRVDHALLLDVLTNGNRNMLEEK